MKKDRPSSSVGSFDKLRSVTSSYFLIFLAVILTVSLVRNIYKVRTVEESIKEKEEEVNRVEKEHQILQDKLERTRSDEYMEKQLRDKLGLAREGEIVVIMPPPEVVRKFAPKYEEEKEVLPDPNWKKWLKLFL